MSVFFYISTPHFMKDFLFGCLHVFTITCFLFSGCNENTIDPVFYGSIEGTVTFESTGLPAKDVEINTAPTTTVILTDIDGHFLINNIPTGEYNVSAKLDGYKTASSKIVVTRNNTTVTDIQITADASTPNPPAVVSPINGALNVGRSVALKWTVEEKNDDKLTYDVVLYESNQETPLIQLEDYADTLVNVNDLKFNTSYFWQVNVKNSADVVTNGELWNFKTLPFPDNRFVFSTQRDGNYEIYSTNESGTDLVRLTLSDKDQVYPQFSNNRSRIAYTENTDLDYHIYIMNKDGSAPSKVTTLPVAGYHNNGKGFCWSPDNGKILYTYYDKLYTVDTNGANLTLIATAPAGRNYRSVDWTGEGNKIVVETIGVLPYDNEIHLIDLNTSNDNIIIPNNPGTIQSPSFSIDGKSVLFTYDSAQFETASGRQLNSRILVYDIATGVSTDVSGRKVSGTNDLNPRYSPDGAKIIFENRSNDGSGVPSVWVYDISKDERKKLFDDAAMPDWQ